MGFEVID